MTEQELIIAEEELNEENYLDQEEEGMENNVDSQTDLQKELEEISARQEGILPPQEEDRTTLKFLKDIIDADDRLKTAYLNGQELGLPTFPVRFWLNMEGFFTKVYDYPIIAKYCRSKALITTDTSLSRDGFITALSVTQKRVRERKSGVDFSKLSDENK